MRTNNTNQLTLSDAENEEHLKESLVAMHGPNDGVDRFAIAWWTRSDVQKFSPGISDDVADEWLAQNEEKLQEAMIQAGFNLMSMDPELTFEVAVGDRIYWNDPDDGACSGLGVVTEIKGEGVWIKKDGGGTVACVVSELECEDAYLARTRGKGVKL